MKLALRRPLQIVDGLERGEHVVEREEGVQKPSRVVVDRHV